MRRLEAVVSGAALIAVLLALVGFATQVLGAHGAFSTIGSLAAIPPSPPDGFWPLLAFTMVLAGAALARTRALSSARAVAAAVALLVATVFAGLATPIGHTFGAVVLAGTGAVLVAALALPIPERAPPAWTRWLPLILWLGVAAVMALFSMHRHWAFGSGSWDMGCMIHNFYRASRFLDSTSTVLGDVDFLGDHFMIGIYLYAPIEWIDSSGYTLLAIQSINLAAAAPAIFLIARHRGAGVAASTVLALAGGLAFGMQSAAYFDSHEITVGFGFLCFGIWALETERFRLASLFLVLFALFKESLGAYVAALGLLAIWRGIRARDRRPMAYGAAWIAFGVIWFVLVNRVFMPALIARANPPEAHETFADFGPTVFEAAVGIATHPLKALAAIFVQDEKVQSLAVTFLGLGGLAFFAPEIGLAAAPLIAERFLSSKSTMWEMGYHYAAPLSLYVAWAAAIGWPRARRLASRGLDALAPGLGARAGPALGLYVLASALLVNGFGYRHPANFYKWDEPYFSTPPRRRAHQHAIAFIEANAPLDARLAVQNRILPHLADRPFVYRLGDYPRADWVLLSIGESAWPWPDQYPRQVARSPPGLRRLHAGVRRGGDRRVRPQEGDGSARSARDGGAGAVIWGSGRGFGACSPSSRDGRTSTSWVVTARS